MIISNIDILIRGAKIVDSTGNPWFYGDIAINKDRIVDVQGFRPLDDFGHLE